MKFLENLSLLEFGKTLCLYGAGKGSDYFLEFIQKFRRDLKVVYFVDDSVKGNKNGIPVISFEKLKTVLGSFDYLIITSVYWHDISEKLSKNGIKDFSIVDTPNINKIKIVDLNIKYSDELSEIGYIPTYRCPIRCKFCWMFNYFIPKLPHDDYVTYELNMEEWSKIFGLSKLLKKPNLGIVLQGGEVFMRDDYLELISFFAEKNSKYSHGYTIVVTNGFYPERIQEVLSSVPEPERLSFSISIDGIGETHDGIRGKGTFNRAVESLKILRNSPCKVTVGTIIQKDNLDELDEIKEYFKGKCDAHNFAVEDQGGKFLEMDEKQIEKAKSFLPSILLDYLTNPDKIIKSSACTAGKRHVVILPNGTVTTCANSYVLNSYQPIEMGNLRDYGYNFDSLWESDEAAKARRLVDTCPGCIGFCER